MHKLSTRGSLKKPPFTHNSVCCAGDDRRTRIYELSVSDLEAWYRYLQPDARNGDLTLRDRSGAVSVLSGILFLPSSFVNAILVDFATMQKVSILICSKYKEI
jgi:hypothetical protein